MAAKFEPFHFFLYFATASGVLTFATGELRKQGIEPPELLAMFDHPGYEVRTARQDSDQSIPRVSSSTVEYFPPPPPPGAGGGASPDSKQFTINKATWESWWHSGFGTDKCFYTPIPFPEQGDGRFEAYPDWTEDFYLSFLVRNGAIACFEVHNK